MKTRLRICLTCHENDLIPGYSSAWFHQGLHEIESIFRLLPYKDVLLPR